MPSSLRVLKPPKCSYFCSADDLSAVDLVWWAKLVAMVFRWGWWCWLYPGCPGKARKEWGNSPTGVETVGESAGWIYLCWGRFGVELGANLNWPKMGRFGELVNAEVADINIKLWLIRQNEKIDTSLIRLTHLRYKCVPREETSTNQNTMVVLVKLLHQSDLCNLLEL